MTFTSHDSEDTTLTDNNTTPIVHSRNIFTKQKNELSSICVSNQRLPAVSFLLLHNFWLSGDSEKMTYKNGTAHEEHMCACAQTSEQ